jgi:hypothetical protein
MSMTERELAQAAERQRRRAERLKAQGNVQIRLWVPRDLAQDVKALVAEHVRLHQDGQEPLPRTPTITIDRRQDEA